jgi:transcriptional regulator with XRE-family HTH domain
MSTLDQKILNGFRNKEFAHSFMDELVNTYIATQIKILRNQNDMTQGQLAEKAGMRQERISVLENVNYSSWSLATLRDLGRAFDLVPFVSFEKFSTILPKLDNLRPESLERLPRMDDLFPNVKWIASESTDNPNAPKAQANPQSHATTTDSSSTQWSHEV